jgi:hypothetical protein
MMEVLASKALGLVVIRLERRCQGGLRRAVERWIHAAGEQAEGTRNPRLQSLPFIGQRRDVVDQDEQNAD